MTTIAASIPVLRWAAQRARLGDGDLAARFPKWPLWLSGESQPTLKQLEDFAHLTHTAIGYFFLPQPPALELSVPDFRTMRDEALSDSQGRIKIPNTCVGLGVWFMTPCQMLRIEQARFVLGAHA